MTKDEVYQLFRKTCAAIEDQRVPMATVETLLRELEATGDEEAIACARHTMQWRSPQNQTGAPPPKKP